MQSAGLSTLYCNACRERILGAAVLRMCNIQYNGKAMETSAIYGVPVAVCGNRHNEMSVQTSQAQAQKSIWAMLTFTTEGCSAYC